MSSDSISFCRAYKSMMSKNIVECIWQAEQRWSLLKIGIPSHLFIQIDHSKHEKLFCWEGRALIHALACGMEHASNLALLRELDSIWSLWKHSESMWWETSCWLEGHDELTRQRSVWKRGQLNGDIASVMCRFDTHCNIKDSTSDFDIKGRNIGCGWMSCRSTQTNTTKFSAQTSLLKA